MITKSVKYSSVVSLSLLTALAFYVPTAFAEEIVLEISGNGSGSSNEVSVESSTQTSVNQTNEAQIENNVSAGANTGGNQANSNTTGEVAISTGDASVNVKVASSGNTSTVDLDCCTGNGAGAIKITGNGNHSENTVSARLSYGLNVNIKNNAEVVNNVSGKAITGQNTANGNLGDVLIRTGSIFAMEKIENGMFNVANVSAGIKKIDFSIIVKDNAANSKNTLVLDDVSDKEVNIENNFTVVNDSSWELVTGQNTANGNLGGVLIATGDITYESVITNSGNVSSVDISCCPNPPAPPVNPPNPPSPPASGGSNGGSSGGTGGTGGSTGPGLGGILPATGANFMFLFLLLNTLFFLFGVLMKLRGGRSPGYAYAI